MELENIVQSKAAQTHVFLFIDPNSEILLMSTQPGVTSENRKVQNTRKKLERVMQSNRIEGEGCGGIRIRRSKSTSLSRSDEATGSKEPTTITSLTQNNF